jgi:hypothetical protein
MAIAARRDALVKNFECRSKKARSSEEIAQTGTVSLDSDLSTSDHRRSDERFL